jgi:hypothetical protein
MLYNRRPEPLPRRCGLGELLTRRAHNINLDLSTHIEPLLFPSSSEFIHLDPCFVHHIYPISCSVTRSHAMNPEDTYRSVQQRYASVANQTQLNDQRNYERKVATAFGYDPDDLRSLPENANLGVSCGNPLATANISLVR